MSQVVLVIDQHLLNYFAKHHITLEEYSLLFIMNAKQTDLLEIYLKKDVTDDQKMVTLQPLIRKGLMTLKETEVFRLEDYTITEYGKKVCLEASGATSVVLLEDVTGIPSSTVEEKTEFDLFIDKYLELFPKGIKNGGNKPLRSNATDVKAKMYKFMNKYKHTKETILRATTNYIDRMRGVYTYCPTSEYFIMKDGSSALATECEMVKNGLSNDGEMINPFQKRM